MANNNNENRKSYLAMNAGISMDKNGNEIPHAFLVEGIVTNVGSYREAEEGKPAVLNLSVLVGRNPWALLGKDAEEEQKDNPNINAEHPFVSLGIFGADAKRLKDIQKNAKVIFCGRPVKNAYKKKATGEDVVEVAVNVDSIYQAQNKYGEADGLRRWVPSMINSFKSKGEKRTQHLGLLSCKVANVGDIRTTPTGWQVITATVTLALPALEADARINRTYNKDEDYGEYMQASIAIWGDRAAKLGKILVPGNELVITATSSTNVGNNGRKYVNLNVRNLSVMKWAASANGNNAAPAETDEPAGAPAGDEIPSGTEFAPVMDDDGDMELPF